MALRLPCLQEVVFLSIPMGFDLDGEDAAFMLALVIVLTWFIIAITVRREKRTTATRLIALLIETLPTHSPFWRHKLRALMICTTLLQPLLWSVKPGVQSFRALNDPFYQSRYALDSII